MVRSMWLGGVVLLGFGGVLAQVPEPPRSLPPSVTGATGVVTPASGNTTVAPTPAPMARFAGVRPGTFPFETDQALVSVRLSSEWLARYNQVSGLFIPGWNLAIDQQIDNDSDFRQAIAAWSFAEAAKFKGDDWSLSRASHAALTMLALTKTQGEITTPNFSADRGNRVGFAAVTAMAIYALPQADAKLKSSADGLIRYLMTQVRADGVIQFTGSPTDNPAKLDPEGANLYPGLVLQAMATALKSSNIAGLSTLFTKAMAHQCQVMKTTPNAMLIATTMPALVEYALMTNKDASLVKLAFEQTDWLLTCQMPRNDSRRGLAIGGFRALPTATNDPTYETAWCALALCQAARLTRQTGDTERFAKYRTVAIEALGFLQSLQFTHENSGHFEKSYREKVVNGGVRLSSFDATLRIDATAASLLAHLNYLQAGTETP
ncbi:MAG: hypothetical protein ACRC8S_02860 [Fimbriiglobus sp.]